MRLGLDDVKAAVEPMVRAFAEDPLWVGVFPDKEKREPGMRHMFRFHMRYCLLCGEVHASSSRLEGIAVWLPGRCAALDLGPVLRAGVLRMPFAVGLKVLMRMRKVGETLTRMRTRQCKGEHWYVAMLGVDPSHQRQGIGRRLLAPKLDWCRREGLPVWLETETDQNVRFYERLGFEIREEEVVPDINVRLWGMLKLPG
jgi:ribosomal protein S18 acetylase RimI-like enzyme